MPLEYIFKGWLKNSPISAKAAIEFEPLQHFGPAEAENGASDHRVLAAGQFEIETGSECKDRRDPPRDRHAAIGRLADTADELQQRCLAGAVAADDAPTLTATNLEADVPQNPVRMIKLLPPAKDGLHQLVVPPQVELKRLADVLTADCYIR